MINLEIGINKVYSTLYERVTIDTPYYLLKLINLNDKTEKVLSVIDSTPFSRVSEVSVELVTNLANENLASSKVYLDAGSYRYEFYQSSTTSLIISDNKKLETGLLLFDVDSTSTQYNTTNTEIVYGG